MSHGRAHNEHKTSNLNQQKHYCLYEQQFLSAYLLSLSICPGSMAFNFNWSPLTADASFYTKAQELLTTALNKSPKPPIIVDDILVNELNLGSVPPDLEILEIGDLAEDRFRGIFKMCYTGDAFLTLKTRVQVGNRTKISVEYCSSSLGKPSQYLSIYKTFLHIPSASRCLLRPDDPSTNHTIRNQAVRVHYTGIFKAERSDACVSK